MKKIFLTLLAAVSTYTAFAQTTVAVDEVVITASRFERQLSKTGRVIQVISSAEIERSSGKTVLEVLNNSSGIVLNGTNNVPGSNISVYTRGANNGYTLILIDGISVGDPSLISNAQFDLNLISIDQVERIEILKGGQSTIYGSDAVAGVINIITKKASKNIFNANGTFTGGSFNTFKQAASVNGIVGLLDYNASFSNLQSNGFSAALDEQNTGNFDKDVFTQRVFSVNTGIKASESIRLGVYARNTNNFGAIDAGSFTDDKDFVYSSVFSQAGATFNAKLANSSALQFVYNLDNINRRFINDNKDGSSFSRSALKGNVNTIQTHFNTTLTKKLDVLTGLDFKNQNTDQESIFISNFGTFTSKIDESVAKTNIFSTYTSFYLNDVYGFNIEIGGRYNNHSVYGDNFTYTLNPSYSVNDRNKIFVNISSAFKTPSLFQLYSDFGNLDLKPEVSQSYEVGFQTIALKDKIKFGVTAFARDIQDVIEFALVDPMNFTFQYINIDEQNDYGFEVELEAVPFTNFTAKAFYNYVDGKVNKSGTRSYNLFKRPRHIISLNAGYQATSNLFVSTNFRNIGKREDLFFNNSSFSTERVRLDRYYTIDLYAEYKAARQIKLFIDLKNITDKDFVEVVGFTPRGFHFMTGVSLKL